MNTFDVLKRRGVKINFTAVITVIVLVVVSIILFTCRSGDKEKQTGTSTTSSNNGKSTSAIGNPASENKKPESTTGNKKNDNTFDDYAGTSKLFKKFKFVGNSSTMVYHVTNGTCPSADKMNPDNIVELKSKDDAKRKGYSRCDICNP